MKERKTTKEIIEEYNISRQTIQNWIRTGLLKPPKKDFRNWFIWDLEDEKNLKDIITEKTINNNKTESPKDDYLYIQNRRYLGSKQKLLPFIKDVVEKHTENVNTVADIFGGTGVVSNLFRSMGKSIIINDLLYSNYVTFQTWFGNENIDYTKIKKIISELNSIVPTKDNYVSLNFGDKYFSIDNAKKIGEIREKIETFDVNERERSFLLTSLIYAIDKVANTVGHYDAYRKKMDSFQPIHLKTPIQYKNINNEIYCKDANSLVMEIEADLVYIDTPYNSRQYGDAYHLLENIVEWKKPKVEGVAKKMIDRSHIKSDYSTKKAPEAFSDLIQNIEAKYILVSYNNMAKKGNGRSNAKISNEEIIDILNKKGKVQVFETPFQAFTTGKTKIDDHKELLYLCTVDKKKGDNGKENVKKYVQSAINYTGGKYKLLPQIIPLFPEKIKTFYDVFAGGGNVGLNVKVNKNIVINDIEKNVIDLYQYLQEHSFEYVTKKINKIIDSYGLSDTKKYGYFYYGACSSKGLKDVNKKSFEKLRSDYNKGKFAECDRSLVFYVLIVFGFNNQIRFNSSGKFNMPTGKRDFNNRMELKLKRFKEALSESNIILANKDFRELLNEVKDVEDFVYLDPPYLITTASYNENGGWSLEDERDLLQELDELNERGIKFALSNVLVHKSEENVLLKKWAEKYNINYLEFNYNNSNYQSKAKNSETIEVLITNY